MSKSLTAKEISKSMADLARFKWSKRSKAYRSAHGKMMSDASQEARKARIKPVLPT